MGRAVTAVTRRCEKSVEMWPLLFALLAMVHAEKKAVPTHCVYNDWTKWGACTAPCGGGIRTRHRPLDTGSSLLAYGWIANNQSNPLVDCPSAQSEISQCNGQKCEESNESFVCSVYLCFSGCIVSEWSKWSTCTCHEPRKSYRARQVKQYPHKSGVICPPLQQERHCIDTEPCFGTSCSFILTLLFPGPNNAIHEAKKDVPRTLHDSLGEYKQSTVKFDAISNQWQGESVLVVLFNSFVIFRRDLASPHAAITTDTCAAGNLCLESVLRLSPELKVLVEKQILMAKKLTGLIVALTSTAGEAERNDEA